MGAHKLLDASLVAYAAVMPTDEGPRLRRAHYAILGVAGIVIATVFAVVASLAAGTAGQVRPVPDLPGPVIADSSTTGEVPTTVTISPTTTTTVVVVPTTTPAPAPTTVTTVTTVTRRTTTTKPPPKSPVAKFAATCNGLSCTFDGSGSSDPDGTIVYWAWSYGDSTGRNGQRLTSTSHAYQPTGGSRTYTVTLMVVDNDNKVGRASANISVTG
jgi:hypothetical protein